MQTVEIGGKKRKWALNVATFRIAELIHGEQIDLQGARSASDPARMFWIGLLADDKNLKEMQVLDWLLDEDDPNALINAVIEAAGPIAKAD